MEMKTRIALVDIFAKLRLSFVRSLSRLMLGPIAGNVPTSIIRSVAERMSDKQISQHVDDIIKIYPASIAAYEFPPEYPLSFRRTKVFEERHIYLLRDVIVSPRSGMVWLAGDKILEESIGSLRRIIGWGSNLSEAMQRPMPTLGEGRYVVAGSVGFFHWLFEVLPNLVQTSRRYCDVTFIVWRDSPSYILESIALLLGVQNVGERVLLLDGPAKVKSLIMPQIDPFSGFVNQVDVDSIRTLVQADKMPSQKIKRMIYVSRTRTSRRKLSNELALQSELEKLGLEIVYAESLTLEEQIQTFRSARIVVGPHGAGLSNLVWSDNNCSVFEIFPFSVFNDCYARLATSCGMAYDYVDCEKETGSSGRIPIDRVIPGVRRLLLRTID